MADGTRYRSRGAIAAGEVGATAAVDGFGRRVVAKWESLAGNLFMHYAFDAWMAREFPGCPFERYADDAVVHCMSRRQAEFVLAGIAARMTEARVTASPGEDAERLLQRRSAPGGARAHLVHLPRVRLSEHGGRAA